MMPPAPSTGGVWDGEGEAIGGGSTATHSIGPVKKANTLTDAGCHGATGPVPALWQPWH